MAPGQQEQAGGPPLFCVLIYVYVRLYARLSSGISFAGLPGNTCNDDFG